MNLQFNDQNYYKKDGFWAKDHITHQMKRGGLQTVIMRLIKGRGLKNRLKEQYI